MDLVIESITSDEKIKALAHELEPGCGAVYVSGLWGSSAPMVTAWSLQRTRRPALYVTSHLEEADRIRDDLELFAGEACSLFPAWETLPGEGAAAGEIDAERLRLCAALHHAGPARKMDGSVMIVAPIHALMQPVPTPAELERNTLKLGVHDVLGGDGMAGPDWLAGWAVDRGFARLDLVESPGDLARRGDIVDLFVLGENQPYRIEFDEQRIESIRRFDLSTQRSLERLEVISVTATPDGRKITEIERTSLLTYLPDDTLIVLDGPSEIQEMGRTVGNRLGNPPEMFNVDSLLSSLNPYDQLHLSRLTHLATRDEKQFHFDVTSLTRFEGKPADAVSRLCEVARDHEVHVICDNEGERHRLAEMVAEHAPEVSKSITLLTGVMHRGFEWRPTKTIVVGHHEIFQRQRQRRRLRRTHASRPLESWLDLKPGDAVVHVMHGIATYRGLSRMGKGGSKQMGEFLTLEFAEGARVHVPTSQVDLVQKYVGAGGVKPRMSKLGGSRWSKSKEQAAQAVGEMAELLLRTQAARETATGEAYPPDTEWQREFDASFLYEETEDQLLVARDIREDLCRARPMDRLVCGDVGYGKTELAMRATFKVAEFGRQVAVLVPTTVLAEQHYRTFTDRFADYPFVIKCLSRFRTPLEQKKIIDSAKKGHVDIVVGTHRLVSKDVSFANLGLVIIDEEQRFGVEHKERLKAMRETVDVLTLTATPIPRTLHMAMMGIRDISSLQTPPVDRRAIATQVRPFDRELIRDAVIRELNRDGQVFFVHNYVQSIAAMADTIRSLVPEARVVFAHGQMKDDELESVMHTFIQREADVLVSTTIIESGIDIPTANTIFINRADRFGLADLHQLRGRVGRSAHRAYCYLLVSPDKPIDSKAAKRLKAVEEFSELGAGFRIAMRDLEIRGAGSLLGREQSGHISSVGYELYCRLLERAVRTLRDEPDPTPPRVEVDLDVTAHIPPNYVASDRSRIEVYRRIAGCLSVLELDQLEKDLIDAFGAIPTPVIRLLEVADIRIRAAAVGVRSISLQAPDVVFTIESVAGIEAVFAGAPGTVRMPDPQTIHLRLPANYLEPQTLLAALRKMFTKTPATAESCP